MASSSHFKWVILIIVKRERLFYNVVMSEVLINERSINKSNAATSDFGYYVHGQRPENNEATN